jgi:hypothetical protein
MKSKKILTKLIRKNQKKTILLLATLGMFIGYFILFISMQLYFDMGTMLNRDKDLFQKDFLVINKKISLLNTVKFVKTGFSNTEINKIRNQDFVQEIGLITSNKFKVGAYTDGNDEIPPFYAEMFFESVPDDYLDINSKEWQWDSLSPFIPIVLPRDYLKLYNFGFAQSQNLPQISEEIAGKALADFIIEGNGHKVRMKGKIVGFTDRINSILVPETFMNWANTHFGRATKNKQPSRLVMICKDPISPNLIRFLNDNNYETNTQQTKGSRLNTLLQIILGMVSMIGVLIIILALVVFIVSFKLMIARAHDTIDKLLLLGYHYLSLSKKYILIYSFLINIVFVFSLISLILAKNYLNFLFYKIGYPLTEGLNLWVIVMSFSLSIVLILFNSLSIIKQFKKQAS